LPGRDICPLSVSVIFSWSFSSTLVPPSTEVSAIGVPCYTLLSTTIMSGRRYSITFCKRFRFFSRPREF